MSMGMALRKIGGGPVEVMLRVQDFAMRMDHAKQMGGVGQELVAFVATGFREVADDVWCFDVVEQMPERVRKLGVYVCGSDVLMVRSESNLSV